MKPDFAIIEKSRSTKEGHTAVVRVDTRRATFQGRPWRDLSHLERKNFEDLLVLTHIDSSQGLTKVLYS